MRQGERASWESGGQLSSGESHFERSWDRQLRAAASLSGPVTQKPEDEHTGFTLLLLSHLLPSPPPLPTTIDSTPIRSQKKRSQIGQPRGADGRVVKAEE